MSDYQPTEQLPAHAGSGGSNTKLLAALGVLIVACVVVLVLALLGTFDTARTSGSPRQVAAALLDAGKAHDVDAARKVLCERDLQTGTAGNIASMTISRYSIDAVSQSSDTATVTATVTDGGSNRVIPIPVIKEKGAWKVCLLIGANLGGSSSASAPSGSTGSTGSAPTSPAGSTPVPSVSVPTDVGIDVCHTSTTAEMTAQVFVGALALGQADLAKPCVFNNSVPASTLEAIAASDTLYSQTSGSGSTFVFTSSDGTKKLTVTVTKESDGKFYVTGLQQG